MRFPFDIGDFDADDFMEERPDGFLRTLALLREDEGNREAKIAPDTTGVDKFFIEGFVTGEMSYDFWEIARDFLKHHYPRVTEFHELALYDNDHPSQSDPESALQKTILNIIYNAAKAGDPYSVELMKLLHKTYHKKEYQQLKRFSKITIPEIVSLSEMEDHGCDYLCMARVLGMCALYGIELEERCSVLYLMLGKVRKTWEAEEEETFYHFPMELFQECYAQVEEWMNQENDPRKSIRKRLRAFWKADRFAAIGMMRQGYPGGYLLSCNRSDAGLRYRFAVTLAILRNEYPKEQFSFEEVQTYSLIYQCVEAIVNVCEDYHDNLLELLGIGTEDREQDERQCLFKPEKILVKEKPIEKSVMNPVNIAPITRKDAVEENYLSEINELRRRLREKEQECKHFRHQYEQAKNSLNEAREMIEARESDREELIALREYIYRISQDEPELTENTLDDMRKAVSSKRIVIIGGHINWINKMKKEFPNWKYLEANISRTNDPKLVEGAEKVYFFTDHLSHATYGKYIAMVRENNISFGYIHTINMEALVRQVYEDLVQDER